MFQCHVCLLEGLPLKHPWEVDFMMFCEEKWLGPRGLIGFRSAAKWVGWVCWFSVNASCFGHDLRKCNVSSQTKQFQRKSSHTCNRHIQLRTHLVMHLNLLGIGNVGSFYGCMLDAPVPKVWGRLESYPMQTYFLLNPYLIYCISDWWFGTWIFFFHILGRIIPTDFHIFQRGWNHQPYIYIII